MRGKPLIVVFYALSGEVAPLRRKLSERSRWSAGATRGFRGQLGGVELIAVNVGVGALRAQRNARIALGSLPPAALGVSAGVAGALSATLAVGDIVVANRLILAQDDSRGDPIITELRPEQVVRLSSAAEAAGLRTIVGPVLTAPRLLETSAQKRLAALQSGALAVDMESAVVAAEASKAGLPFVCIRTILDTVDDDLTGAAIADAQGRVRLGSTVRTIIRNPVLLLGLPRLARNFFAARKTLAEALEALGHQVGTAKTL